MTLLNEADAVYIGDMAADCVYLGDELVWSSEWKPSSIPGLGLWLEADKIIGLADGAPVTNWLDSSGKGHSAVPLATPPTWRQAGMNGRPSVQFTANPITHMKVQGWGTALSGKTEYTMFQVLTTSEVATFPVITSAPANSTWTFLTEFGPNGDLYWGHPGNYYNLYKANVLDKPMVYSFVLGGGAGKFYKEGTEIAPNPAGLYPQVGDIGADVLLGGYYNNTLGMTGHVAAMIWYDRALTDVERQQVEDYLMAKYIPWTPLRMPSLGAWYDPAQDLYADGERVVAYREHSVNQFTYTGQAGQEPIFRTSPRPHFEHTASVFGMWNQATTFNAGLEGLTLVMVGGPLPGTAPMAVVVGPGMDGYEMRFDNAKMMAALSYTTSPTFVAHPTLEDDGTVRLHVIRIDVPAQKTDLWVDAVLFTGGAPTRMRNVPEALYLGVREGGYPYFGTIYEALVFAGPISDDDLILLMEYLRNKHQLTRRYW